MVSYDFYKKIEDDCNLAKFFNKTMHDIILSRMAFAPRTFKEMRELEEYAVSRFYETCLWEMWMHGVIYRLRKWEQALDEYFNEYSGSWKFYALCRRKELIEECGGDDDDYNEDGTVKTDGLTDEDLIPYTVLKDLIPDDFSDIVCDSSVSDLTGLPAAINTAAQIHIEDVLDVVFGKEMPSYIKNEEGGFRKASLVEKALNKAIVEANGEESAALMYGIIVLMCAFCISIKSIFSPTEDNMDELKSLKESISRLLSLDSSLIEDIRETFMK